MLDLSQVVGVMESCGLYILLEPSGPVVLCRDCFEELGGEQNAAAFSDEETITGMHLVKDWVASGGGCQWCDLQFVTVGEDNAAEANRGRFDQALRLLHAVGASERGGDGRLRLSRELERGVLAFTAGASVAHYAASAAPAAPAERIEER